MYTCMYIGCIAVYSVYRLYIGKYRAVSWCRARIRYTGPAPGYIGKYRPCRPCICYTGPAGLRAAIVSSIYAICC